MFRNTKVHSRNSSLKLLTTKENKPQCFGEQIHMNNKRILQQQCLHMQPKDLNCLITTKISLGACRQRQKTNYNRISSSQLSFNTENGQINSRIQKLKQQAKYLDQNDFSGPYLTQLGNFSKKDKIISNQQSQYTRTNQFMPSKKKSWNNQKLRPSLKTRRKRTLSTIINPNKFDQFETIEHCQSLSFEMKPFQSIDHQKMKHKKKQTPSIVKRYYKADSFRKELSKSKPSRYDAFCTSQYLKTNKFQEQLEGVNVNQIYKKNKKYEDYVIICL